MGQSVTYRHLSGKLAITASAIAQAVTYEQFFVWVVIKFHIVSNLVEWHSYFGVIIDSLLLTDIVRCLIMIIK